MPSRFFEIPSNQLRHHTVSLLPDVERIIRTNQAAVVEQITRDIGVDANFSVSLNLIVLARFTALLATFRKNQKPDQDVLQYLMDLIDRKRTITDEDLADYQKALADITQLYKKAHNPVVRK
jgi:hypothetical protein